MATKKKPAPAVKRAVKRPTAKKTAARKTAAKKVATKKVAARKVTRPLGKKPAASKTGSPSGKKTAAGRANLGGIGKMLDNIKLSGAAGVLLDGRRKDVSALLKQSRKSYKEVQTLVQRRSRELKKAIEAWKKIAQHMHASDPKESLSRLETIGAEAFRLALQNLQDLGDLATKLQSETADVFKKRIRENITDIKELLRK